MKEFLKEHGDLLLFFGLFFTLFGLPVICATITTIFRK